jgi:hypothetical protein
MHGSDHPVGPPAREGGKRKKESRASGTQPQPGPCIRRARVPENACLGLYATRHETGIDLDTSWAVETPDPPLEAQVSTRRARGKMVSRCRAIVFCRLKARCACQELFYAVARSLVWDAELGMPTCFPFLAVERAELESSERAEATPEEIDRLVLGACNVLRPGPSALPEGWARDPSPLRTGRDPVWPAAQKACSVCARSGAVQSSDPPQHAAARRAHTPYIPT